MSVLIKGMEMPKTESEVLIIAIESNGSVYPVRIDGEGQPMIFPNEEMKNHAVPVPPHGRLIDADALLESDLGGEPYKSVVRRVLMQSPTIIPAEEGEGCLIAENAQGLKSASSMRIAVCL